MRHKEDLPEGDRWGLEPKLLGVLLVLVVVLAGVGVVRLWGNPIAKGLTDPAPVATLVPQSDFEQSLAPVLESVLVYVTGAVNEPGVITLSPGDRVVDAVQAAGGMNAEAVGESLNLARAVVDGEHIHVATEGEDLDGALAAADPGRDPPCVDLNRADVIGLEQLPGIGPALAQRILAHREEQGPFAENTSLQEVAGIGTKTYANLETHLCG